MKRKEAQKLERYIEARTMTSAAGKRYTFKGRI